MVNADDIFKAFVKFKCDKGTNHGYEETYGKVFSKIEPNTLLEVGIKQGRSIAAWDHLFPDCLITGIDIVKNKYIPNMPEDWEEIIVDSTSPEVLEKLGDRKFDVIIDDGSHFYKDIMKTWDLLHDRFKYAYIIEDSYYKTDEIIENIKQKGYTKIYRFKSNVHEIPVVKSMLTTGKYKKGETDFENVLQYILVIMKEDDL